MNIKDKYLNESKALRVEIDDLKESIKPVQRKINDLVTNLIDTNNKLAEARRAPRVTDHAVIRYLERVYDFDFEEVRRELLTKEVKSAMIMGATKVKQNNYSLILKGNTIVTVTK